MNRYDIYWKIMIFKPFRPLFFKLTSIGYISDNHMKYTYTTRNLEFWKVKFTYWFPIRWIFWKRYIDDEYGECYQYRSRGEVQ